MVAALELSKDFQETTSYKIAREQQRIDALYPILRDRIKSIVEHAIKISRQPFEVITIQNAEGLVHVICHVNAGHTKGLLWARHNHDDAFAVRLKVDHDLTECEVPFIDYDWTASYEVFPNKEMSICEFHHNNGQKGRLILTSDYVCAPSLKVKSIDGIEQVYTKLHEWMRGHMNPQQYASYIQPMNTVAATPMLSVPQ